MATDPKYIGYLKSSQTFGSPFDQADGTDVVYTKGTRVKVLRSNYQVGYVWITAPNGREKLVPESDIEFEPELIRIDGRYRCVMCGKAARDHPSSEMYPWPTFYTLCDGREVKT